jgi:hypothetical protein
VTQCGNRRLVRPTFKGLSDPRAVAAVGRVLEPVRNTKWTQQWPIVSELCYHGPGIFVPLPLQAHSGWGWHTRGPGRARTPIPDGLRIRRSVLVAVRHFPDVEGRQPEAADVLQAEPGDLEQESILRNSISAETFSGKFISPNHFYDFWTHNYNASIVVHRLGHFSLYVVENIFVFKTHEATRGVANFYSAGVLTRL